MSGVGSLYPAGPRSDGALVAVAGRSGGRVSDPKKHGLGRGLSALLGEAPRTFTADGSNDGVQTIEVARIRPNPAPPPQHFDQNSLGELAESIATHGVLQPILVRTASEGFEIIAGERRWRA